VPHRADRHAAPGQFVARRDDVGHDQVQALRRAGRGRGDPGAEPDRAFRARRDDLDDPLPVADRGVDDQHEAQVVEVELLRPVHVGDGDEHQFEFVVHTDVTRPVAETHRLRGDRSAS
jgi:hypothetical protein